MSLSRVLLLSASVFAMAFIAPLAKADSAGFTGYYTGSDWTISNSPTGSTSFSGDGTTLTITGAWGGENVGIFAAGTGTVSFSYTLTGAQFGTFYANGSQFAVSDGSGTGSFEVTAGQEFGFDVGGSSPDNPGHGVATITNFSAPLATPEPSGFLLLGSGVIAISGAVRRRFAKGIITRQA